MRIFVTGTGRCGTVTFSKAAAHADNYTVGHESHAGKIGNWEYPDNHIEVSSQLMIAIPILQSKYPDAKWIHLVRIDREACVKSLARMDEVMRAFSFVFFQHPLPSDLIEVAESYYDCTVRLIQQQFTLPRFDTRFRRFALENAKNRWLDLWNWMACRGDFNASRAEWDVRYNASEP